jgi:hypothetical protein
MVVDFNPQFTWIPSWFKKLLVLPRRANRAPNLIVQFLDALELSLLRESALREILKSSKKTRKS